MKLMAFKNSFLECLLIYVYAIAVETVLAIVVADHLSAESPLLFLSMINDPYSTNINLLAKVLTIFNSNQFFYISDPELILELKGSIIVKSFKLMSTYLKILEKKVIATLSFKILLVRSVKYLLYYIKFTLRLFLEH